MFKEHHGVCITLSIPIFHHCFVKSTNPSSRRLFQFIKSFLQQTYFSFMDGEEKLEGISIIHLFPQVHEGMHYSHLVVEDSIINSTRLIKGQEWSSFSSLEKNFPNNQCHTPKQILLQLTMLYIVQ